MSTIKKLLVAGKEVGDEGVLVHLDRRFAPQAAKDEDTLVSLRLFFEKDKGISLMPEYVQDGKTISLMETFSSIVEMNFLKVGERRYPDFSRYVSVVDNPFTPTGHLAICPIRKTPRSHIVAKLVAVQYTSKAGKQLRRPTQIEL